jgi:hypothetical protein
LAVFSSDRLAKYGKVHWLDYIIKADVDFYIQG